MSIRPASAGSMWGSRMKVAMPAKRGTTMPETGWKLLQPVGTGGRSVGGRHRRSLPDQSGRARRDALDALNPPIEFLARDGERRREAQHRAVGVLGEYALGAPAPRTARAPRRLGIDLDADPEAASAHVGDRRCCGSRAARVEQISRRARRALDEALALDQSSAASADRGGERVAAEGRAVEPGVNTAISRACRTKAYTGQHAAAERLAEDQPVRADALVLAARTIAPVRPSPVCTSSTISSMPCRCRSRADRAGSRPAAR